MMSLVEKTTLSALTSRADRDEVIRRMKSRLAGELSSIISEKKIYRIEYRASEKYIGFDPDVERVDIWKARCVEITVELAYSEDGEIPRCKNIRDC